MIVISRSVFCSVALLILGLLFSDARAQSSFGGVDPDPGAPGTGGRNMIDGHIYLPSGQPLNKRAKIRLDSIRGGTLFTMSDDNGAFTFRRLSGGSYRLVIDAGADYEIVAENVDIIEPATRRRDLPGQIIPVQIYLRPRERARESLGLIDATLVGVPPAAAQLYKEALELARQNKAEEAIDKLRRAIEQHPSFVSAYNELGVQYMRRGKLAEALEALRTAVRLSPYAFVPRLNYGIALVRQRAFAVAEEELQRAIDRRGDSALAHVYLGRARLGLGKHQEAEAALRRALALGGREANLAHRYLGALYIERGESAKAIEELETYLRLEPHDKDAKEIREIIRRLREAR